jgi:DNA-binding beta-propeller fold protein YncE
MRHKPYFRLFAAATASLLLLSCAAQQHTAAPGRSWPPPPYPTRIVWTGAAAAAKDLEIGPGFWGALWEKIAGGRPQEIGRPYGIHADCRKRILVVDSQKRGVHLFDRAKEEYSFIGGDGEQVFTLPIGVTEDQNSVAYVTDSASGKVFRFTLAERRPTEFAAGLKRPTGITFNPTNRRIYVADTLAGQIVAFDLQGKEVLRFGRPGHGAGEFNHPTDLAVDFQGRVYVTDAVNARIQIFSREGAFIRAFGEAGDSPGYFGKPKGVAVNSEGQIYVCDALHDTVQVFDQEGRLLLTFGSTGSGSGEFWMPSGIAIDKDDNIYVADTYNKRIQLFNYVWLDQ